MHFFVGFEVVSFVDLDFLSTNEVLHNAVCSNPPNKIGDTRVSWFVMTLCDNRSLKLFTLMW